MAGDETRSGVCFPGTGIARRREPECRAPMFSRKLKHRKENRHHEKLHTPEARTCPEPNQPPSPPGPNRWFYSSGLDVHNDSIAVSLAPSDSTEVRRYGIIGGEHDDVLKLAKKLQAAHPGATLKFCYEAGPRGFALCRCLRAHGLECIIWCVPRRCRANRGNGSRPTGGMPINWRGCIRAGELTGIYVPEPADEAMRDLIRARYQVGKAQHRARQQLKMYLLRHNLRYGGQTSWSRGALALSGPNQNALPGPADRFPGNARGHHRSHRAVGTLRPGD